ncbi:MAG TPA: twin-arginine translocase TatA/TatE family subunit [Conexibacter sp.]|nr:twin-arginine translocase TatA/TatE family subunit [Conexibacter sp.]
MFSQIGPLEIVLVIVVLLVIFGPKRLPAFGRSLGSGIREFKESVTGEDKGRDEAEPQDRAALTKAQEPAPVAREPHAAEAAHEQRG